MADLPKPPQSGNGVLDWLLGHLMPWLAMSRLVAGRGIELSRSTGGTLIGLGGSMSTTVDLRGQLFGPWDIADGQFIVVDVSTATATQQAVGTVRPSNPPQHEVWIDLSATIGRVYIPRLG